jgi:hypothetical protein
LRAASSSLEGMPLLVDDISASGWVQCNVQKCRISPIDWSGVENSVILGRKSEEMLFGGERRLLDVWLIASRKSKLDVVKGATYMWIVTDRTGQALNASGIRVGT